MTLLTLRYSTMTGALMGSAAYLFAQYPLITYPLFVPAGSIVALHPGIGMLGTAGISGYLALQRYMQLRNNAQNIAK